MQIVWMEEPGAASFAGDQLLAFRQALCTVGHAVHVQRYQPRVPWRVARCDWLIWTFVPTRLDVWSARFFAGRQLGLIHTLPNDEAVLPRLDRWCVPSESLRMQLKDRGVPAQNIEVVQGYAPQHGLVTGTKLPFETGGPVIYLGGLLNKPMDQQMIARCMTLMQQLDPSVCLLMHGEGAEREKLTRLAQNCCWPGTWHVAPVSIKAEEMMAQADVICLPMTADGVPDLLFAALRVGKPIVVSRQPSIMEWIRHQENGWIVDSDRPPPWAVAMHQLFQDKGMSKQLSEAARMTAIPSSHVVLPASLQSQRSVLAA